MHEHDAATQALLWLPVAIVGAAMAIEAAARQGSDRARLLVGAVAGAGSRIAAVALLTAVAGVVHLALAPAHAAGGEPVTAGLFVLDGTAQLVVAAGVLALIGGARRAALGACAALAAGGLLAYAVYLALGLETADAVGLATKALEAITVLLVLASPARFSSIRRLSGTSKEVLVR